MRLYHVSDNQILIAYKNKLYAIEGNQLVGSINCMPKLKPPAGISIVQQFICEEKLIYGLNFQQIFNFVKEKA
ncbi:MAG: hypothetical protein R3321_09560, partial [Nitrososphaeraceae archaeon]|nr:hypothetical protein [Nitrososphaeraceae archaeon]